MECPNCAGQIRDTARYCNHCGQQLGSVSAAMSSNSAYAYISHPEQLVQGIVRILGAYGEIAGTGFVVSESGLIATCSHVIQHEELQTRGMARLQKVKVIFHTTGDELDARIEPDWWLPWDAGDMAILQVEGVIPQGVRPLPLGTAEGTSGHDICTFGFPSTGDIDGIGGDGKVVRVLIRAGKSTIQLRSNEITVGFSGAPVWDKLRRRVIGMVSDITKPDPQHRLVETAFAIATETLRSVCSALQISDVCPYRGLAAFREDDAEFFFGRQQVIDGLLNRLRREPRFLVVLGPSGCGKSSVVQAGFIPQLRNGKVAGSDRWGILVIRAADNPFEKLAEQGILDGTYDLTGSVRTWLHQHNEQERLVLVFDQFEELFVTCPEALRQDFVAQLTHLLHAPLPITVVLVLRDDFYSRLTRHEELVKWLEHSQGPIHIPRILKQDELTAIVQKPAEAVGLRFEEGLVEVIVKDSMEASLETEDGDQAGRSSVLPLLEFALNELWKRSQEGVLTYEAYRKVGAVAGALTQWADGAYFALKNEEQRKLTHRIFTDLVYLGDEGQGILDSRRRRLLSSLCRNDSEQQVVQHVVQQLVEHRLLVTDRDLQTNNEVVEIIHDALLRTWGRLKQWIEEDREFLAWHQKLEEKMREWVETDIYHPVKRDVYKLLGGGDLTAAKAWQAKHKADLRLPEQAFIEASEQRQRKAVHRRSLLFAVLSILSVIAIVLASVAEVNIQRAQSQSQLAATRQAIADSRQLATQAVNHLDDNLALALLLSVEANHLYSTVEAKDSLLKALEYQPHFAATLPSFSTGANGIAFSPDGKTLAVGGQDQTFTLWDVGSRRPKFPQIQDQLIFANDNIAQAPVPVNSMAFSPDGKLLATGTDFFDGTFRLWNMQSKQFISPPISVPRGVSGLAFSPKGNILAIGSTDGTFSLWDVASQRLLSTHRSWMVNGDPHAIHSELAFSPDGSVLAVGSNDIAAPLPATFTLWDMRSQQLLGAHLTGGTWGGSLSFSPDSKILAVGGKNDSATLWDVKSQSLLGAPLTNPKANQVNTGGISDSSLVAFSPTGHILAVGGSSGTITLWDMVTHQMVDEIKTNSSLVSMIFSPDGGLLSTIGNESFVNLWYVLPNQPLTHLLVGAGESLKPAFSALGLEVGTDGGYDVAVNSDGHTIARQYCSKINCIHPTIHVWSMVSQQQKGEAFTGFPGTTELGSSIALSPDGRILAVAGCHTQDCTSGELQLWNVVTHQLLSNPIFTNLPLARVAYSPDGKVLAAYGDAQRWKNIQGSGRYNGDTIYLWDVRTGRLLGSIDAVVSSGFSFTFLSDNDTLAAPYCTHFTQLVCDHRQIGLWNPQNPNSAQRIISDADMQNPDYLLSNASGDTLVATSIIPTSVSQTVTVFLWNVANDKLIRKLNMNYPLALTPDGKIFITGNSAPIQLLDAETLYPIGPPLTVYMNYTVEGMVISNNTNLLYGWSSSDGMVVSWNFNVDSWKTLACQMANRNLTLSEWKQFIGTKPYSKTCPNLPSPS